MKTVRQIAREINKRIREWAWQNRKLIVAIDGYTGSGKTSVANEIAKLNPDCLVVHLDRFVKHWRDRKRIMDTARDRSRVFEYNWYRYDAFERLVRAFKNERDYIRLKVYDYDKNDFAAPQVFDLSKKVLVVEGILLLYPKHKRNALWGKRVFLRVDYEKAEARRARRVARNKKKRGKDYHPDTYLQDFKVAYNRYMNLYSPEQKADLVIDVDG